MNPKITVVTAVYNNEKFIKDAVESVLGQSYPNVEFIVVDGASTDKTLEVISSYSSRISRIISEKDKGIYDALNKGIEAATGEIIGFLHSDDLFNDSEVLERVIDKFKKLNCDGVYSDLEYVSRINRNKVIRYWKSCAFEGPLLAKGWMPPHPTLFLKKTVYDEIGLFDCRYKISADYDFILRTFLSDKFKIEYIPFINVRMRLGGESNKKISNLIRKSREDLAIMRMNGLNACKALVLKNLSKLSQFVNRSN